MKLMQQSTGYSCCAASVAMLLGISEREAAFICKTKTSGTHVSNVIEALKQKKVSFKSIHINGLYESWFGHLRLLSNQYPIFVSAEFICNSGRGRNGHRHHAFVLNKGKVLDPAYEREYEMDSFGHVYNRALEIKQIILIGFPS